MRVMQSTTFTFKDQDGVEIFVYKWAPGPGVKPRGAVQVAHGMMEHAGRYADFASALVDAGFIVYANDHRGHGKTGKSPEDRGLMGPNGWHGALNAMKMLADIIIKENPGVPLFLLGHSWGSFLTQHFIQEHGSMLKGAILSGTNGKQKLLTVGSTFANLQAKMHGIEAPGDQLHELSFAGYDKKIKPKRTKFDWLSRDEAVVQKYIDDPDCGFICKVGFFVELLYGLRTIWSEGQEAKIPKDLPVYIFNGSMDAVGLYTKGVEALIERYRALGLKDLTHKFYEGARHEMLNELNKDEVYRDVIAWLDAHA